MRNKGGLAFMVVMVAIMLVPLWVQKAQGETVTGMVLGRAGEMKSMAGISMEGPSRYMSMTNSEGEFRIKNVKPGRYTLTVTQGNYVQKFNVNIEGNQTLNLKVRW
ncbi:MAG: carboxypeptidase-like regulatory domain-containing protein [Thermodesulfobacteriota bacterium]